MTDPDDPRAQAAADRRDDAYRPARSDAAPLAFPLHLLPVEADEDAEVVLEEVIASATTASRYGLGLVRARRTRLLYEAEGRGVDPREVSTRRSSRRSTTPSRRC